MKIWFDTEFLENGVTIKLISIGLVREDGATYYAETSQGARLAYDDDWLSVNVLPHLRGGDSVKLSSRIARDIIDFAGDKPEFWAYYASYDWVALCQLYGRMIDMPKGWPMRVRDVMQMADVADPGGLLKPSKDPNEHCAMADAVWTREYWEAMNRRGWTL